MDLAGRPGTTSGAHIYTRQLCVLGTLVGCRFVSGAAVAGGSEVAGERLRRAAFGPEIPPSGEAKLPGPPISGQKSSLRIVTYVDLSGARRGSGRGLTEKALASACGGQPSSGAKIPLSGEAKLPPSDFGPNVH